MKNETALAKQPEQHFTDEQIDTIKRAVAPTATDHELKIFLAAAERSGLDPFQKHIYFIKDKSGRFYIHADVHGLQARAEGYPDYRGIEEAVVYEHDEFVVDQDSQKIIKHVSNPFKAGRPVGAWCRVTREGMKPFFTIVHFSEYTKGGGQFPNNWDKMPRVMIDKVAKSVCLRKAFPKKFSGIYGPEEIEHLKAGGSIDGETSVDGQFKTKTERLTEKLMEREAPPEVDPNQVDLEEAIARAKMASASPELAPAVDSMNAPGDVPQPVIEADEEYMQSLLNSEPPQSKGKKK